jgi:homoserine O-acetyltransferase
MSAGPVLSVAEEETRRTPPSGAASVPGRRHPCVQLIDQFELESGQVLSDVRQAYYFDGELNAARDNLVVVVHALTGSADAVGDWWREVVGPGRAIDTNHYAVLCTNLLGSCYGSTGPAEEERRPFPKVTTRDMARLIGKLVSALHVESVALALGGSLGGMVAMELAATFPSLTRNVIVLAAPAEHPASAIAWSHIQRRAIELGGEEGLEIARMIAMMTYRTATELEQRFGREPHSEGGFRVERYLTQHGRRLRARFDVHSYLTLLNAMDTHDVGRGRGGVARALERVEGRVIGVGIPGDLLYEDRDVQRWTEAGGAEYREIDSLHGHDAFLIESEQVSELVREVLAESRRTVA